MVYVISCDGKALMPTKRHAKVRVLLKEKKAKVVETNPFTIKLLYSTKNYVQPIHLGIDSGYTYIGFSALTDKEEVISGELTLLSGQKQRLEKKAMHRGQRRSRKRHRKPRFDNRAIPKGWLAPSIQHKLDSHKRFIDMIKGILPISEITIEIGNFDIQKIKNPLIEGSKYQEGEQKNFYNLREHILHRDNHTCQYCGEKELPLQVHHIGYYKKDMSNRPSNLTALCIKCHKPRNHKKDGVLWGMESIDRGFKEATFMSTIRKRLVDSIDCKPTYGYLTKSRRISLELEKTHYNDAFCIARGSNQNRTPPIYYNQVRRNNRSLEKFYDAKYIDIRDGKKYSASELSSGRRTRNKNLNTENLRPYRGIKTSKGRRSIRTQRYFYQPNDLVKLAGKIHTVRGSQNKGKYVALREVKKVPRVDLLTPYKFRSGISVVNS